MKTTLALGLALALPVMSLTAQTPTEPSGSQRSTLASLHSYRECDLRKIEKCLLVSLNDDIEGVVAGTLREVAKIKLAQPDCTSEPIEEKVNDLVRLGATAAIQYKAYLTGIVLASPWAFEEEGRAEFNTDEQFFTALARRLEGIALRDER